MKIALHMSMLCENWTDSIDNYFEPLKKGGLDGVEISLYGVDKKNLVRTIKTAQENGLEVSLGTGITPETDVSSSDESIRRKGIEYLTSAANFAIENGAKFINGVLYAPWQAFSKENRIERMKRSAESLAKVSDSVDNKLDLNVEVINRFETDFMNTLQEGKAFVNMIDRKNIRLLADTFHMNIEEDDMLKSVEKYYSSIGSFHVCENHRGVPGTGHIPFKQLISFLKSQNYKGFLTMESFVQNGTEVGDSMKIWRELADDALSESIAGARYLRKLIEEKDE